MHNYVKRNSSRFGFAIQVLPSSIENILVLYYGCCNCFYLYSYFVTEKCIFYYCNPCCISTCILNKVTWIDINFKDVVTNFSAISLTHSMSVICANLTKTKYVENASRATCWTERWYISLIIWILWKKSNKKPWQGDDVCPFNKARAY